MNNKFDKYINVESELEKDSRYIIQTMDIENADIAIQRQNVRIYIFYFIIVFIMILILKAITDDFKLVNTIGLNFFNICNIPSY